MCGYLATASLTCASSHLTPNMSRLSRCSLTGSYLNFTVSILLDDHLPSSSISTNFALATNIPRTIHSHGSNIICTGSGPLYVPTVHGWFVSNVSIPVEYVRGFDIVLGRDWFDLTSAAVTTYGVLDPSLPMHQRGIEWVPFTSAQVHGESSVSSSPPSLLLPLVLTIYVGPLASMPDPSADDQSVVSSLPVVGGSSLTTSVPTSMVVGVRLAGGLFLPSVLNTSLFIPGVDNVLLHNWCESHGLSREESVPVLQRAFLDHLLSGECVVGKSNGYTGCAEIAGDFVRARELGDQIREYVLQRASVVDIHVVRHALQLLELTTEEGVPSERSDLKRRLCVYFESHPCSQGRATDGVHAYDVLDGLDEMDVDELQLLAESHGVHSMPDDREQLRVVLFTHLSTGRCATVPVYMRGPGCDVAQADCRSHTNDYNANSDDLQIWLLSSVVHRVSRRALLRLLNVHNVDHDPAASVSSLRRLLNKHITWLKKGKRERVRQRRMQQETRQERRACLDDLVRSWPQTVPSSVKEELIRAFRRETSSQKLATFTFASCSAQYPQSEQRTVDHSQLPLDLLAHPSGHTGQAEALPPVSSNLLLRSVMLDPHGITFSNDGDGYSADLCSECHRYLKRGRLPPLALANGMYLGGEVPEPLRGLTFIEEAVIARHRAKSCIVQLKDDDDGFYKPNTQRGFRGHIIVYPQRPDNLASILPPAVEDIVTPICIVFVGSRPPDKEWLRNKAKPLIVRREKIKNALMWLVEHNPLYADVQIDEDRLSVLPSDGLLDYHIEHVPSNTVQDALTSRYDANSQFCLEYDERAAQGHARMSFDHVVVTDVDGRAPAHELRAAAIRHIKQKGGSYLEIPHGPTPVNEFCNPSLFPLIYPTLFPYGVGGFEDDQRAVKVSFRRQVKHFMKLRDRRFQIHHSFLFTAFNILQRRSVLLHSSLKVRKSGFERLANDFASISLETVSRVCDRISQGETANINSPEERRVLNLMREVQLITKCVPGSSAARVAMRNEIRGLMLTKGMPSFYLTINPADVYCPVVKFLAGEDIDVDRLLPNQVPDFWDQSILIAQNPVVAARFFNLYMKAFISSLLGYDVGTRRSTMGILGNIKAYYGCVEAQGRGTLHCHMIVWVEGGLDPNEIKERIQSEGGGEFGERLIRFLDDTISNGFPDLPAGTDGEDAPHPCAIRGFDLQESSDSVADYRKKDIARLIRSCQVHKHSSTCYKYWGGPPEPRQCRFDLDAGNVQPVSVIDSETGELRLRCLDGLVNNFNDTILEAMRCNMDIKFIGSGEDAKAVLYYITDYITKSQLKVHVAYAALELAVRKLSDIDFGDDRMQKAKRMLQRCAFSLLSNQELSSQQVVSYLLDFEDHFTSHSYSYLFWPSFERYANKIVPSPECYQGSVQAEHEPQDAGASAETQYVTPVERILTECEESDSTSDLESDSGRHATENEQDEEGEDEVGVTTDSDGSLVPLAAQVSDYVYRGEDLAKVNLWSFVAQVKKVYLRAQPTHNDFVPDDGEESEVEELPEVEDDLHTVDPDITYDDILSITSLKRPMVPLLQQHIECGRKVLKVMHPDRCDIPVPIGPTMPRCHGSQKARYCRLMLILFVPWRSIQDLKDGSETWIDSYERHLPTMHHTSHHIMRNLELMHQCRESRDDHFRTGKSRKRHRMRQFAERVVGMQDMLDDTIAEDSTQDEIVHHLDSIDREQSRTVDATAARVDDCISIAEKTGLSYLYNHDCQNESSTHREDEYREEHLDWESVWKSEYEKRRVEWKCSMAAVSLPVQEENIHGGSLVIGVRSQSSLRTTEVSSGNALSPHIADSYADSSTLEHSADINHLADVWTLNEEQKRAYRIIASHSMETKPAPLRMYIGGFGGTGKSRVIQALKNFFEERNQSRRFRLASFTGMAAKHISGTTLHAALGLKQRSVSRHPGSKANRDLKAMWDGVDYLLIDEVSMVGCQLLALISESLMDAKGNDYAFGNVNVIVAGDFAQLPPVTETRLYAKIDTSNPRLCGGTRGQQIIYGKLLWLSFDTVVILRKVMRQHGSENEKFVDLLGRLRLGQCTLADYELLKSRVMCHPDPHVREETWKNAPIIVSDNACKDALNAKAAQDFSHNTGRPLRWFYAQDFHSGQLITERDLVEKLRAQHSGKTNHRLGKLPLVEGMPVIVSQNYDVNGGVVNGTIWVLRKVRTVQDRTSGEYLLKSCIISIKDVHCSAMTNLPEGDLPILQDVVDMTFKHKHSNRKCVIKRYQVPIQPAFAITCHKAQGQTFDRVIVDLESCKGSEAPYVMLSRARSLESLLIFRPFKFSKITCRQSEDLRNENRRLEVLDLQTIVQYGSYDESSDAQRKLAERRCEVRLNDQGKIDRTSVALPDRAEDRITLLNTFQRTHARTSDNISARPGKRKSSHKALKSKKRRVASTAASAEYS